jgi:3',5'-cyclic AMP phosphodiesterase CpdA
MTAPRDRADTTVLVHLSDLHFGRVDPETVNALEDDIRSSPPDLVIVSGDLTQGARRREFKEARAFLDRLGAPFLAVPGNHDISPYDLIERFTDTYERWRTYICPDIEPMWTNGEVVVVGLNSARPLGLSWDWSRGRLNRRQLRRMAERLQQVDDSALRIATVHHPLLAPEDADDQAIVGRARMALETLTACRVDLVLSGHLHRNFLEQVLPANPPVSHAGTTAATLPTSAHTPTILLSGTATSTRIREDRNSYHRIMVQNSRYTLERRHWTGDEWIASPVAVQPSDLPTHHHSAAEPGL